MPSQSDPVDPSSAPAVIRIKGLAAGGDGVGRLDDGCVVFVEGGVPGDRVELDGLVRHKRMARARVGRILEASPDRVEPRCAHFGVCGGCQWQHVDYSAQLEAKRGIVRDALDRIGGIVLEREPAILASPDAYGYRARARLVEAPEGIGYRRRRSHVPQAIRECPILVPSAQERLRECVEEGLPSGVAQSGHGLPRRRKTNALPEWEILAGLRGPARMHRVGEKQPTAGPIEIEVAGDRLRASPGSFVQSNALLWQAFAHEVCEQSLRPAPASETHSAVPGRLVELYAGIGFLTLPLARAGWTGVAFESGRSELADLRANLSRAGLTDRIDVVSGRIEARGDWAQRFADADLLVVDPPRVGLDPKLCGLVANSGPRAVVYVSCDPATLARDLRILLAGGYRLSHLRSLDLFPQTPHVEVVVRLDRI